MYDACGERREKNRYLLDVSAGQKVTVQRWPYSNRAVQPILSMKTVKGLHVGLTEECNPRRGCQILQ